MAGGANYPFAPNNATGSQVVSASPNAAGGFGFPRMKNVTNLLKKTRNTVTSAVSSSAKKIRNTVTGKPKSKPKPKSHKPKSETKSHKPKSHKPKKHSKK